MKSDNAKRNILERKQERENQYLRVHIDEIIDNNPTTKTFVFDRIIDNGIDEKGKLILPTPGQFVMVWIPGLNEKPISLSGPNMITVRKITGESNCNSKKESNEKAKIVGEFTTELFRMKSGKYKGYLNVRGPYGKGFPDVSGCTAIGGGCGIAPLYYLIGINKSSPLATNFVLAGKTKSELLFLDEILDCYKTSPMNIDNSMNVVCATQDGSYGINGLATDVEIPKAINNYYICGPEMMIAKVAKKLVEQGVDPKKIYVSLERYMKCGLGICDNCLISGKRVCADGPVFRYDVVQNLPHFNAFQRLRTGELIRK
jgi:dihydroorotate dehydrogenase electron transfer subunit